MAYICDYDEGYTRVEAEEIGWCGKCRIASCPKSKAKAERPFKIICNRCGSTRVKACAYEYEDLGLKCLDCGQFYNAASYEE